MTTRIYKTFKELLSEDSLITHSLTHYSHEHFSFARSHYCFSASRPGPVGSAYIECAWTLALALAVLLHARQTEWTARLDFLWQVQARDEKRDMDALQVRERDPKNLFETLGPLFYNF